MAYGKGMTIECSMDKGVTTMQKDVQHYTITWEEAYIHTNIHTYAYMYESIHCNEMASDLTVTKMRAEMHCSRDSGS